MSCFILLTKKSWSQQNNLGDTLAEVFQEFIKIPPRILSYAPPVFDVQQSFQQTAPNPYNTNNMPPVQNPMGTGGYPPNNNPYGTSLPPPPITGQNQFQPPQQQRPSPQDTRIPIPQMPAEFDEVNRLSEEEMKNLIDDNQSFKFDEFFENLQYVKNLNSLYKDLREANLQIAKSSIEKEQQTNKKKQSLLEKQQKLQLLQAEASKKASIQSEISNRYRPENLLVILNQKIDEVEKESDAIGEQFLNQGGDVKQFMDSFLAKRALFHLRQEKKDRFKETYCN
jgi:ESCRT-I complex subunit VPS37